jgi:hypothetical protein
MDLMENSHPFALQETKGYSTPRTPRTQLAMAVLHDSYLEPLCPHAAAALVLARHARVTVGRSVLIADRRDSRDLGDTVCHGTAARFL